MPGNAGFKVRTWPVYVIGLASLLGLLFLPGIAALRRTAAVYKDIRRIQDSHRESQRLLAEVERRVYLISITVREALLDSSSVNAGMYRSAFEDRRRELEQFLTALKALPMNGSHNALPRLEKELDGYLAAIEPIFHWTSAERSARATYFLREQQRPRRQSVIEIAGQIGGLAEAAYSRQLDQVNASQIKFDHDIQRVLTLAFLIGVTISAYTILRIRSLEERAERHRWKTEKTEDELRSLTAKLMQTQEEERRTISRELHDEVGQTLTGLRMGLAGLERLRHDEARFQQQAAEMKALAEQALRAVRDIAVGLRPSVLDLGLLPAVQWQARRFSAYSGVPATVHPTGDLEGVPEEYRTCIYRVVQECLTNAVKHSGARSVRVDIRAAGQVLEVAVRDDGTGFRPAAAHSGLGLIGMEERVRELGGTLKVESAPASGTSVIVRLEMRKNPEVAQPA